MDQKNFIEKFYTRAYEDYSAVKDLLGRLDDLYWHDHYVPPSRTEYLTVRSSSGWI